MGNYCCNMFQAYNEVEKQMGLNLRIVKLSDAFIERGGGSKKKNKVFYITEGYSGAIKDCNKTMVINYCPFCGTLLEKKYDNDSFVNEIFELP